MKDNDSMDQPVKSKKQKTYLTPNEVAELLMVSPITVRQWSQKGLLNAQQTPGGHRRYLYSDVARFAAQSGIELPTTVRQRMRILVVDDDTQLAGFLAELLADPAYDATVAVAHNGFEAGQKVATFDPDIVLLDLMMPGINGIDVCRTIKGSPNTKAIRVITMTGYYTEANRKMALDAGAEACLPKPLDSKKLLAALGLLETQNDPSRQEPAP